VEKAVKRLTSQVTIQRMRFACWISKATNTYSECVILRFHGNKCYVNACQYYVACLAATPVYIEVLATTRLELDSRLQNTLLRLSYLTIKVPDPLLIRQSVGPHFFID
jgi:hypothetical protein